MDQNEGELTPLPPIKVQAELVKECEKINTEIKKAMSTLTASKSEIEALFQAAFSKANETYKIGNTEHFELSIGKRVLKDEISNDGVGIPVYSANVFEPFGHIKKKLLDNFNIPSVLWGIDGDWMVNYIPEDEPFYPTDHCGVLRVKTDKINPKYLAWALHKEGDRVRFSRTNRASMDSMRTLSIKVPSKEIQSKLIKEVEKIEKKIKESQEIIAGVSKRKEAVIKSYLMGETAESELAMASDQKQYTKGKYRDRRNNKT